MLERVARFIADPRSEPFEELAAAVCREQLSRVPAYAELCARRGVGATELTDWRRAPLESPPGAAAGPRRPRPELRRAALEAALPAACLAGLDRPPVLSLLPPLDEAPDSGLALMADHVVRRFGSAQSAVAAGRGAARARLVRSWLAARQRAGHPVLLLATTTDLLGLLDSLERLDLRFRLPAGSRLLESVGDGEPAGSVDRRALAARLAERLALGSGAAIREYGGDALASRFHTRVLGGGDPEVLVPPPWARVRILDPETLQPAPAGASGRVAVFDLAGLGAVIHLLTEDLGVARGAGFRRVAGDSS